MNWDQKINVNTDEKNEKKIFPDVPFGMAKRFSSENKKESEETTSEKDKNIIAKFLDSVIKFSICALFFGLPLFFTNITFQGTAFDKQIYFYFWILLALVAWGSRGGYVGEMKIKRTPLDIPIIIFWLFYLINTIFSVDRWHSFVGFFGDPSRGLISITALIIMYYLILSNFSQNLLKWIMRAVISSGAIFLIWELVKMFNLKVLPASILSKMPLNTIGSLQSAAIFSCFLILIFMAAVLNIQKNTKINPLNKKIYSAGISFLILIDLIAVLVLYNYLPIFGRFPLIGLVVGTAFFLIFVLAKIVRPKEAWTLFPMVMFIIVLAFLMIGKVNLSKINLPFNVSVPYKLAGEIAKDSAKDSFFLGYGPGNYGYAFSKFLPKNFDNMNLRFYQGEGIMLESISTIGAIGTVLLSIIILTFIGTSIFLLYREKEKNKIYSLGLFSATLVLLVNALLSQTEAPILIILMMMATLSMGILYTESDVKEKAFSFSLKTSPKFALTLAFISLLIFASVAFLFVFFGKIFVADVYMGSAIRAGQVSIDGSVNNIIRAIQLNNKEGRYMTRLGQEYLVLTNDEMLKGDKDRDMNKIQGYLSAGVQAGTRGRDLMKNDVTAVETLAQIYENSGIYLVEGLGLSEKEYQRALELEPNNPSFYMHLGRLKMKMASTKEKVDDKKQLVEEAKDMFQKSLDVRSNYDLGYYNLSSAQEALGQLDESINSMSSAVAIQRNNINYVFNLARLYQSRGKGDDNKIAESLFKQILGVNDKEINSHFNLGLLYEKTDRKAEATDEYRKVVDLLPEGSETTKSQLEKMIDNIKKGIENTPENLGLTSSSSATNENQNQEEPAAPTQ